MFLFNFVVIVALLATIVVLVMGISSMARGGAYDLQHSVQYMYARVGMQGIAVLFMLIALYLANP